MMLNFGESVRRFYGNYTNPEGRAQRSAYWWVQLYQTIILIVLVIVILMAEGGDSLYEDLTKITTVEELTERFSALGFSGRFAFYCIIAFSLVNFLPSIMISIRRFHDLDRTGWLVLVFFIAGNLLPPIGIVASLINFFWFMFPGTEGPNKYGQDPLGSGHDIFG